MPSSRSYQQLANDYRILLAKCNDLKEQNERLRAENDRISELKKQSDDATRKLCESILAKDRNEMKLGETNDWSKLDMLTLIAKAVKSFQTYNKDRQQLLKNMIGQLNSVRDELHSKDDVIAELNTEILNKEKDMETLKSNQEKVLKEMEKKLIAKASASSIPDSDIPDIDIPDVPPAAPVAAKKPVVGSESNQGSKPSSKPDGTYGRTGNTQGSVGGNTGNSQSTKLPSDAAKERIKERERQEEVNSVIGRMSPENQKMVKQGGVNVIVHENDMDDTDIDALTGDIDAMATENEAKKNKNIRNKMIKPTDQSVGVVPSKKMQEMADTQYHVEITKIHETAEKMNDIEKEILRQIGECGQSIMPDISKSVIETMKSNKGTDKKATNNGVTTASLVLSSGGYIETEIRGTPFRPKITIVQLTEKGKTLYKYLFDKDPVTTLADKLIKENDNLNHGLGIYDTAAHLEAFYVKKKVISDVTIDREHNTIQLKDGFNPQTYIPDIRYIDTRTGKPLFIEYEMGTHTDSDWAAKMNKAVLAGGKRSIIQILVPNLETVSVIEQKTDKWIANTREFSKIRNVVIRIASARRVKENSLVITRDEDANKSWDSVYILSVSKKPFQMYQGDTLPDNIPRA